MGPGLIFMITVKLLSPLLYRTPKGLFDSSRHLSARVWFCVRRFEKRGGADQPQLRPPRRRGD